MIFTICFWFNYYDVSEDLAKVMHYETRSRFANGEETFYNWVTTTSGTFRFYTFFLRSFATPCALRVDMADGAIPGTEINITKISGKFSRKTCPAWHYM